MADLPQDQRPFSQKELETKRRYLRAIAYLSDRGYTAERIGRRFGVHPDAVREDLARLERTLKSPSVRPEERLFINTGYFKALAKEFNSLGLKLKSDLEAVRYARARQASHPVPVYSGGRKFRVYLTDEDRRI